MPEAEKLVASMRSMVEDADVSEVDRMLGRHTVAISLNGLGHRDAALREAEELQRLIAARPPEERAADQIVLAEALALGGAYRRAFEAAGRIDDADDRASALNTIAGEIFYGGPKPPADVLAVRDAVDRRLTRALAGGKLGGQASASVRINRWVRACLASGAAGPADGRAPAPPADPAERVTALALVADAEVFRLGRPIAAVRPWLDAAAAEAAALPPAPPPLDPTVEEHAINRARAQVAVTLSALGDPGRAETVAGGITNPLAAGQTLVLLAGDHLAAGREAEYDRLAEAGG